MMKIFLWCTPTGGGSGVVNGSVPGGDVCGYALAEDGRMLVTHVSSNEAFSKHDLGFTSTRRHGEYASYSPTGFELVWVSDPAENEEFKTAYALYEKLTSVEGKSPVETLRQARYYTLRVRKIQKVHVTYDFYLRLQADENYGSIAPVYNVQENYPPVGPMPLFGIPCEVHIEPCKKEFWFEGDDGREIVFA